MKARAWVVVATVAACVGPPRELSTSGSDGATPAGSDWQIVVPADVSLTLTMLAVSISEQADVYVGSQEGSVSSSHDHGTTWTTSSVGAPTAEIYTIATAGQGTVYAGGLAFPVAVDTDAVPFIAKSADGGMTWSSLPLRAAGLVQGLVGSIGTDAQSLFVTGAATDGGFFARSVDGGTTWTRELVSGTNGLGGSWVSGTGDIYAIAWRAAGAPSSFDAGADARPDAAAAPDGADAGTANIWFVLRSRDGGGSWSVLATSNVVLGVVSGTSDGARIVAVGDASTILESNDYGATWSAGGVPSLAGQGVDAVWVADAVTDPYVAAGGLGLLRVGNNGGADYHYTKESIPGAFSIYAVGGFGSTEVWAVGEGGLIARKTLK